jgi:putative membrane protein
VAAKDLLPHVNGGLNAVVALLLLAAFAAIRAGKRALHARLMAGAIGVGLLFLSLYVLAFFVIGHRRFPGDDWVRTLFLVILGTHELCAVIVVPLLVRTVILARRERFDEHRRSCATCPLAVRGGDVS